MDLHTIQYIFYILGIIVMTLGLLLLIALTLSVFYIKKKIDSIHNEVESRINVLMEETVRPAEQAIGAGVAVAGTAIEAARSIMGKRKRKKLK